MEWLYQAPVENDELSCRLPGRKKLFYPWPGRFVCSIRLWQRWTSAMPCDPAKIRTCGNLLARSDRMPDPTAKSQIHWGWNPIPAVERASDKPDKRADRNHFPKFRHLHRSGERVYSSYRKPESSSDYGYPAVGSLLCGAGHCRIPNRRKMERGNQRPVDRRI